MNPLRYLKQLRIAHQLILWFLLVAAVPLALATYLVSDTARRSLRQEVTSRMLTIANHKAERIETYVQSKRGEVTRLAQTPEVARALRELDQAFQSGGLPPAAYQSLDQKFRPFFSFFQESGGYHDLFLIGPDGDIVFTVKKEDDRGTNLRMGPYRDSGLARVFGQAQTLLETDLSSFEYYSPSREPVAFIAAPVFTEGRFVGAVALQMSSARVYELVQDQTGLGDTGETVVAARVGHEVVFTAPLRFDPEAALKRRVTLGDPGAQPIQEAVQGKRGMGVARDYRGVEVLAVWRYLPSFRWGMVVKIDVAEAFAPVRAMLGRMLRVTVLMALLVTLLACFVAGVIAPPITRISAQVAQVAQGNLNVTAPEEGSRDEIGVLARGFNQMLVSLRRMMGEREQRAAAEREAKNYLESTVRNYVAFVEQVGTGDLTGQVHPPREDEMGVLGHHLNAMTTSLRELAGSVREATGNIISRTIQIRSTTNQQAATISQQAAAVSETSSTIAEMRQTARHAADRAQLVSESTQESLRIAGQGLEAVRASVAGMNLVKEQMSAIAETILDLREQTQQIEEIIATVNKLADRSSLLALNAAIEAARAGEAGKGFAVVAGEVRSLADQSRQATERVRDLLGEIQKAANAAVLVTEEGSQRANVGVAQAQTTGETIRRINEQVQQVAQAAQQIAVSAHQQLTGMDHIATAMEHVNEGALQSEAGIRQVEAVAQDLNALAEQLDRIVEQYKLT